MRWAPTLGAERHLLVALLDYTIFATASRQASPCRIAGRGARMICATCGAWEQKVNNLGPQKP